MKWRTLLWKVIFCCVMMFTLLANSKIYAQEDNQENNNENMDLEVSEDINANLLMKDGALHKLKVGTIFKGVIEIWPSFLISKTSIEKLVLKQFSDLFYLASISTIEKSVNNQDVWVISALFVLTNPFENNNLQFFKLDNKLIPFSIKNIEVDSSDQVQAQNYIIIDQEVDGLNFFEKYPKTSLFIVLIILLLVFLLIKKWIIRRKRKIELRKYKELKNSYHEKFLKAQSRKDFEEIYELKEQWSIYLKTKTPALLDFYRVLNEVQFKESWTSEDLNYVKSYFDEIRTVMSDKDGV